MALVEQNALIGPRQNLAPLPLPPRAEVDTSAPFESVKEAVDRFGGSAQWNSQLRQLFQPHQSQKHLTAEELDVIMVEEQTAQLEKDLIMKERDTLDALKELEMTKRMVGVLKSKLQREEASAVSGSPEPSADMKVHPILETEENPPSNVTNQAKQCPGLILMEREQAKVNLHRTVHPILETEENPPTELASQAKQPPGLILMELKQAKLNLNRTTDLAIIRASIEILTGKIEKEKALLDNTRSKLASYTALASSLEEELQKLQGNPSNIAEDIKHLSEEIEQYRKMKEASRTEVLKLTAEIEQIKASIKMAEIRWFAAKKVEVAAKAAESVAVAEIKALMTSDRSINLSIDEYADLLRKAQEADEISSMKIKAAMVELEEANQSKLELLMEVEKAAAEVINSRKALEEAMVKVEVANEGKLAVEEALRKWRSEHGQKRRYMHSTCKFKNTHPGHHRRDSRMLDVNGLSLDALSGGKPTLSIGQILSRKLMGPELYCIGIREKLNAKPKVSLGQMLSKKQGEFSPQRDDADGTAGKQNSAKRKKFGQLVGFSLLKVKQNKKMRKNKKKREETCSSM